MSLPQRFVLPDLIKVCPFEWSSSPFYDKAGAESAAWIDSFDVFRDRKRAHFIQSSTELLVSYVYPYAGYEEFRTCCDLINLLFVVDEISDDQDPEGVRETGNVFLKAMSGEMNDGSLLARITSEFKNRYVCKAGANCQKRMLARCANYVIALAEEAGLRQENHVLDVTTYMSLRRENSAVQVAFCLFEYVHGIDLPDKVFEDATFMRLYYAALDLFILANDLYSYNMEQAKGLAGNNIVTVFMKSMDLPLQRAVDHVGRKFEELIAAFTLDKSRLCTFGSAVDKDARKYIFSLENAVVGNLVWSFESKRYFGNRGQEIQRTLLVEVARKEFDESDDN